MPPPFLDGSLNWGEATNLKAFFMPESFRNLGMSENLFLLWKMSEFKSADTQKAQVRQHILFSRPRN
jgi:hypothetical protein